MITHSPEFKINKLNNYDNTVLNVSRQIYEQNDLNRLYPKNHYHQTKPSKTYENLGHHMGAGNRAYLYGSWSRKKERHNSRNEGINPKQLNLSNQVEQVLLLVVQPQHRLLGLTHLIVLFRVVSLCRGCHILRSTRII